MDSSTVLLLQRQAGNEAVSTLLGSLSVQRKAGDQRALYEQKLREAVDKMTGTVKFGRADRGKLFNQQMWDIQPDPDKENKAKMLVLHPGIRPSIAIDLLFDNLDKWSFDCAQFVQAAELYALRHSLGAAAFDKKVAGQPFALRVQWSTGVVSKSIWSRERPGHPMTEVGSHRRRSVDWLLAHAPIGSRVAWTNLAATKDSPWENENTVKVDDDQYAAHGFLAKQKIFSRADVEMALAFHSESRGRDPNFYKDSAFIAANIFVSRIERYEIP